MTDSRDGNSKQNSLYGRLREYFAAKPRWVRIVSAVFSALLAILTALGIYHFLFIDNGLKDVATSVSNAADVHNRGAMRQNIKQLLAADRQAKLEQSTFGAHVEFPGKVTYLGQNDVWQVMSIALSISDFKCELRTTYADGKHLSIVAVVIHSGPNYQPRRRLRIEHPLLTYPDSFVLTRLDFGGKIALHSGLAAPGFVVMDIDDKTQAWIGTSDDLMVDIWPDPNAGTKKPGQLAQRLELKDVFTLTHTYKFALPAFEACITDAQLDELWYTVKVTE